MHKSSSDQWRPSSTSPFHSTNIYQQFSRKTLCNIPGIDFRLWYLSIKHEYGAFSSNYLLVPQSPKSENMTSFPELFEEGNEIMQIKCVTQSLAPESPWRIMVSWTMRARFSRISKWARKKSCIFVRSEIYTLLWNKWGNTFSSKCERVMPISLCK